MKKIVLLSALAVSAFASNAQYALTGSSYTQNFDGLNSGLPTGWSVYSGAASTTLGSIASFSGVATFPSYPSSDSSCAALVLVGGFKNFPSATVSAPGDDYCASVPPSYTNRALGVRQVSPTNAAHPNLDSGAAFVFEVYNTNGISNLNLSFKLQSLDTASARTTTWMVDYAVGNTTPTSFTPVTTTTGIWTTGNHTFSNDSCTVNFGSALDNQLQHVYIRIVTLVYSSGSGNRASSAIDDYKLTWTGTPKPVAVTNVSAQPELALNVLGTATSENVTLEYSTEEAGNYNLSLYDMTGRILHTENVNAQTGLQNIHINGLHLIPGMYFAKMNNGNSSSVAKIIVQ